MDNTALALLQEVVDRTRRTETRLTKYLEAIGFVTGARKPVWQGGAIEVPSPATSLTDILSVVPDTWNRQTPTCSSLCHGHTLGYVLKA